MTSNLKPVLVEQTAKRLKGHMLGGGIAIGAGLALFWFGSDPMHGAVAMGAGTLWYACARGIAWWQHG